MPTKRETIVTGVRDYAGVLSTVGGVFAAVLYVLLTLLSLHVYAPLGVRPGDVGVTYGDLLVLTAAYWITLGFAILGAGALGALLGVLLQGFAGLGTLALLALVAVEVAASQFDWVAPSTWSAALVTTSGVLIGWILSFFVTGSESAPDATDAGEESKSAGGGRPPATTTEETKAEYPGNGGASSRRKPGAGRRLRSAVLLGGALLVLSTGGLFLLVAEADRERLSSGRTPIQLSGVVPPPWDADVVRVTWAAPPRPDRIHLPPCMLYLGQANGTTVLYDATPHHRRLLRLPTSSVLIEALREKESSLSAKGRRC